MKLATPTGRDGGTRRQFLAGIAALGSGVVFRNRGLAGQTPPPRRIDVHHHLTSPGWTAALAVAGLSAGNRNAWTPARSIESMDEAGVATALLSTGQTGGAFTPARMAQRGVSDADAIDLTRRLARDSNEYGAKMAADYPGRFGLFASVPLLDVDDGLREVEYALDVLKADGIGMFTSYGDKWLGDATFAPLFEELNRRKAVVYTHPTTANCCVDLIRNLDEATIEYQTDTSRAIASLLVTGTAARYPDVRFIFSHAGGTMPFLIYRFDRPNLAGDQSQTIMPNGPLYELRRFYYDTAQSAHTAAMSALSTVVPVSQIVFGSDYPIHSMLSHVRGLQECGVFNAEELRAIDRGNIGKLLPKYNP